MYNLEKEFKQIGDYTEIAKKIYMCKAGEIEEVDLLSLNQKKIINLPNNYWGVAFYEDNFNVFDSNNNNTFYKYDGSLLKVIEKTSIYKFVDFEFFLGFDINSKKTFLKNSDFLISGSLLNFMLEERNIYFISSEDRYIIKRYLIDGCNKKWELDFSEICSYSTKEGKIKAEVIQFIGIFEDVIWVLLQGNQLLGVNINTGSMHKSWKLEPNVNFGPNGFLDNHARMHFNKSSGEILWLSNQSLVKVSLKNNSVILVKDFSKEERDRQWRFMASEVYKGRIYFTGDYGWQYVTASYIGVMNDLGDILWSKQLKKTGGLPVPPKIFDDNLFVITSKSDLLFFKTTVL